ncbi:MAG: hypothetical protein OEO20_06050 [Gemmatimonadota bacterium]|nr:hypothetical protein [Gemmatimonadota bacterium]MDH3367104.1 hypothetical protein [Gemmatimonadota bacterium]MDH3477847.1 hypothetical protein [Gemmatimonadota bacterium]MDH3570038.1 hypothetical protein [Gemmatimonadota bacterium]MDH5550878.1 hypothetical protein [Gemmatimonadota bacterium]
MQLIPSRVRQGLIVLGAIVLLAGHAPRVEAQLALPRSDERFLFLIPSPAPGTDSSFVVALADEVRTRLRNKMRHKLIVIESRQVCEVLEQSAYNCTTILSPADADRLARALQSDVYVTGSVRHEGPTPVGLFRLVDIGNSGLSGWTTVRGTPGDPARSFAQAVVDTLENQVRAAEHARECSDRMGRGDFREARERAERAFRIYPNHPAAALCAEVVSEALRQPPDSQIAYLRRAVRGDSLLPKAWERLGRLHQQTGDSTAALDAFAEQSLLDSGNRDLRLGVVAGAITLRRFDVAQQLADDWLGRSPTDLGFMQLKARACVEGGAWDCALEALAAQFEVDSTLAKDTVFYQQIIGAAQALGNVEAQLEWSARAMVEVPGSASLLRAHASALAAAGMSDSVVRVYDHLLQLDPTDYRSALAGARVLLEDLPIDTIVPLDTARLLKGIGFLDRATQATRDTAVLLNVAATQYQQGSALVQVRKAIPTAVSLLQKAIANDLQGRLTQQTNFFLGLGLMFRIFEFDPQVVETKSCQLVDDEAQMIAQGKRALQLSGVGAERTAPYMQQFQNFEQRIPQLKRAFECR